MSDTVMDRVNAVVEVARSEVRVSDVSHAMVGIVGHLEVTVGGYMHSPPDVVGLLDIQRALMATFGRLVERLMGLGCVVLENSLRVRLFYGPAPAEVSLTLLVPEELATGGAA